MKETSYSDQTLTFASHSKKEIQNVCPSNQVFAAAMTSASDEN
jgi:ABC-type polysaccharide/polyol phosphate transport system ATPase subunit